MKILVYLAILLGAVLLGAELVESVTASVSSMEAARAAL